MLKSSLYIGLGGTGIRTLLKTKKMFIDTYGEIPPTVQFLGIDTNRGDFAMSIRKAHSGDEICLSSAEVCDLFLLSPANYYNCHSKELSWLPKENGKMIMALRWSAGQVRTNGRFAFVFNVNKIEAAIRRAIENCRAAEPANDWPIDVHIVFSLAGGTGSGIFIDVAYLIRKIFGKGVNMYGYAVLPKVFREMVPYGPGMMHVFHNAYGALTDLDFLMHLNREDEPVTFNWIANSFTEEDFRRTPKPFDLVYLVDNTTAFGVKYDHVGSLTDVISLALVAASGEIGRTNSSYFDTCLKVIETGCLDVNNKKAWAASVGASSVVFHPEVFAERICLRGINDALNEEHCDLDTSITDIKEIIDKDRVLSAFHNEKEPVLTLSESKSFVTEAEKYCDTSIKLAKESAENAMNNLVINASSLLSKIVCKLLLTSPGCITATKAFLDNAKTQADSILNYLTKEVAELESNKGLLKHKLEIAKEFYIEETYKSFFIRSKKRLEEYATDFYGATSSFVDNEKEIIRHQFAIQYFNSLSGALANKRMVFKRLCDLMNDLRDSLSKALNCSQSGFTEIDLAFIPSFNDNLLSFGDFYNETGENAFEEIETSGDLMNSLLAFIDNIPEFKSWKEKTISEVIDLLPDAVFSNVFRRAIDYSEPMLMINGKGFNVSHTLIIGVEDRENSRFVKSRSIPENLKTQHIELVSTGIKNRVLFYRQDFAFPAYTVQGVDDWRREYEKRLLSSHFDANIFDRMVRENYSLYPESSAI